MSTSNDFTIVMVCDDVRHFHTVSEDQGVYVPNGTGQADFFCRTHAVERLTLRLSEGLPVSAVAHYDADLLIAVSDELFEMLFENQLATRHCDRDDNYYTLNRTIGAAAKALQQLAQAKSAQLTLL